MSHSNRLPIFTGGLGSGARVAVSLGMNYINGVRQDGYLTRGLFCCMVLSVYINTQHTFLPNKCRIYIVLL